jgi:hypothetical protein
MLNDEALSLTTTFGRQRVVDHLPLVSVDPVDCGNALVSTMDQLPILERAYALARSGACRGANEIRLALKSEDFSTVEINRKLRDPSLILDLDRICGRARRRHD